MDTERLRAEFDGLASAPGNPAQAAMDQLSAALIAAGQDPDERMTIVEIPSDPSPSP